MTESAPRTGRPPKISRAEIVAAADAVVAAGGSAALTMRRVATELGCTPMALYHHVRDKDELLRLLLEDYADRVEWPPLPDDPRERMITAARAVHDVLAARAWVVEILAADDLLGVSALWFPEAIIDGAVACGLTPDEAVRAYRIIWHYTAGEIIIRTRSAQRAADGRPTFREQVFTDLDPQTLPHLAELGPRWVEITAEDTYLLGLRALITGLAGPGPD
ncbi:TetR/AcrR family transcriptional regulator [Nocardia testacea]|uniref:TetR/AcrR family transcriptional regulator n=1 Tax=Nocardia testacea TaxID=248551 RepID=A0ABW7W5R1_9NOCA